MRKHECSADQAPEMKENTSCLGSRDQPRLKESLISLSLSWHLARWLEKIGTEETESWANLSELQWLPLHQHCRLSATLLLNFLLPRFWTANFCNLKHVFLARLHIQTPRFVMQWHTSGEFLRNYYNFSYQHKLNWGEMRQRVLISPAISTSILWEQFSLNITRTSLQAMPYKKNIKWLTTLANSTEKV